jgi:hypothetical protein
MNVKVGEKLSIPSASLSGTRKITFGGCQPGHVDIWGGQLVLFNFMHGRMLSSALDLNPVDGSTLPTGVTTKSSDIVNLH